MKLVAKKFVLILILATFVCNAYAVSWYGKQAKNIQFNAQNGCLYFMLENVSEADPVTPGNPWFTISPNSPGQNQIASLLMMANASGKTVKVVTTGSKVCGYAEVSTVRLED